MKATMKTLTLSFLLTMGGYSQSTIALAELKTSEGDVYTDCRVVKTAFIAKYKVAYEDEGITKYHSFYADDWENPSNHTTKSDMLGSKAFFLLPFDNRWVEVKRVVPDYQLQVLRKGFEDGLLDADLLADEMFTKDIPFFNKIKPTLEAEKIYNKEANTSFLVEGKKKQDLEQALEKAEREYAAIHEDYLVRTVYSYKDNTGWSMTVTEKDGVYTTTTSNGYRSTSTFTP
jgi:hypothetical protein